MARNILTVNEEDGPPPSADTENENNTDVDDDKPASSNACSNTSYKLYKRAVP